MAGIWQDERDPHVFHVDWAALRGGLHPLKRPRPLSVDPFLVTKAVTTALRTCPHKTAEGLPLLWNEYAFFLELSEFEHLRTLEKRLSGDVGEVVQRQIESLRAAMVGPLAIRLVRDEGGTVKSGTAILRVQFTPSAELEAPADDELTIRPRSPVGIANTPPEPGTEYVFEAPAASALRLCWTDHSAAVPIGRAEMGRPHRGAPPGFIGLTGASAKINKKQAWIEVGPGGVTIGRGAGANPVEVNDTPLGRGTQVTVTDFPARLSLSNGELNLVLERAD